MDVSPADSDAPVWRAPDAEDTAAYLDNDLLHGLTETQAAERLQTNGPNRLAEPPGRRPWRVLIAQFKSLLILVLLAAAFLARAIGHISDAVVILVVVGFNALLGFRQEYRAEQAMAALRQMLAQQAEVRRDGNSRMLQADALVPGDIVLLDAGDRLPADGRFIVAQGLEVDESSLTGESTPSGKEATACLAGLPTA